jgi:alpha-L-rhamnosidase
MMKTCILKLLMTIVGGKADPRDQRKWSREVIRQDAELIVVRDSCETPEGTLWQETSYPPLDPPTPTRGWVKTVEDFKLYLKYFHFDHYEFDPEPLRRLHPLHRGGARSGNPVREHPPLRRGGQTGREVLEMNVIFNPRKVSILLCVLSLLTSRIALSDSAPTPGDGAIGLTALHASVIEPPTHLLCEYLADPAGIDSARPRLSWWLMAGDARDVRQTAYQIMVASDAKLLAQEKGDLWDSGRIAADTQEVAYAGKPLASRQPCFWKVRVWDGAGRASAWSATARWSMGLLDAKDWTGRWIGAADDVPAVGPQPGVMLRREWRVKGPVARAQLSICGLGWHEVHLNGRKVGDAMLEPGWTDFDKRVSYVTHDVTGLLREGANAMGVVLGGGYFNFATPTILLLDTIRWRMTPRALVDLEIIYADGSREVVASDSRWQSSVAGPITFNCVRAGESYDARREQVGWDQAGFAGAGWQPAREVESPRGRLVAQMMPPVRVVETLSPVKRTSLSPGMVMFDAGCHMAGWAQLTLPDSPAGAMVTLKFGERLNKDGTLDQSGIAKFTKGGRMQTDKYTARGGGEMWEPRFTYHGFRYAQVEAEPAVLEKLGLQFRVVHNDVRPTMSFACSDDRINRIDDACRWTFANNLQGYPSDNNHRGRLGWMGDGSFGSWAGVLNFDMRAFYRKWLRDMQDAQDADGNVPATIPNPDWSGRGQHGDKYNCPSWGGACVSLPWLLYERYGDEQFLAEMYPAMCRYLDSLKPRAPGGVIDWGLGDWNEGLIEYDSLRTPRAITSTATYYYLAQCVTRAAQVLGRPADAARYSALQGEIQSAFLKKFRNPRTGMFASDSQTAHAMPLAMGMVEPEQQSAVLKILTDNIRDKWQGHISAGLIGTPWVFEALLQAREDDVAFRMVTEETEPGWLPMIQRAPRTINETFTDVSRQGCFSHPGFTPVANWFYRGLAGINVDGPRRFVIDPRPACDVRWVKATWESPWGPVRSEWKRDDRSFTLAVTIPPNTTATVKLPGQSRMIGSGTHTFDITQH